MFYKDSRMSSNVAQKMKNMTNKMSSGSTNGDKIDFKKILHIFILIMVSMLILYVLISVFYYYRTDCEDGVKKPFLEYLADYRHRALCVAVPKTDKQKDMKLSDIQMPTVKEEVFHISNQDYTYDQAKCKCESYGAKLATREQVIESYNKGASWCTYGWSNGQYAFYPVQQCDWDKIEEENKDLPPEKRQHCGKPGMNGGYFSNPYIRFGVNCYGVKPKGEAAVPKKPYCPPMNFCKLEKNFQASHKLDTDSIAPFAPDRWNQV